MDLAAVVLILFLVLVIFVLPIWAFIAIRSLQAQVRQLTERVRQLSSELLILSSRSSAPTAAPVSQPVVAETPLRPAPASAPAPLPKPIPVPPPLVPTTPAPLEAAASLPPPLPAPPPVRSRSPAPPRKLNLEQFVGAKLFAWLGGLTAFLAVAFFVKYSFEHDLIPPEIRVAIGFILSAALIVAGLRITNARYRVTSQVLCATGIVSLYAVTFACNAVYRFAPFTPLVTFALMALITATAFLLAVRMNAQVVALLGLLGGFLTPILVSTGRDNPLGLFTYIALLDLGLVAVALHRRWFYLVSLAAAGTVLMQFAWLEKFFAAPRAPLAVAIALSFSALFAIAAEAARRWQRSSAHTAWSAAALPLFGLGLAFYFLGYTSIAARPGLLFSLVFTADAFLLLLSWRDRHAAQAHLIGGTVVFAFLAAWTSTRLEPALLPWALAASLVFAAMHTAFPVVLERLRPDARSASWSQAFPPLALVLMMIPLLKLDDVPLLFWPAVLLIDALAVGLAWVAGSFVALALVLVLTLAAAGVVIFQTATTSAVPTSLLIVIAVFALFFFAAGLFLARRLRTTTADTSRHPLFGDPSAQIPSFGALLPFILLVMMAQRLSPANPSSLFGLALLLCILVLGLSRILLLAWLPACALAGLAALEYSWHVRFFEPSRAASLLAWYAGFHLLFAAFPVAFRRSFATHTGPWAVAALSGVVQFPLVYHTLLRAWPNDFMGLLPATFALVPLALLILVLRLPDADRPARLGQLAWAGGVALFFITLVFPIQFERQWITISWALEGAALLWLFHRVPHPGLRLTGIGLLAIAFVRLAFNPAVLSYQARGDTPLFNWYLYAYGLTIACRFAGARLLRPSANITAANALTPGTKRAIALLNTFAVILAFLLLNLEIADYFSPAGTTLMLEFSGNFARDLAYTVGWALFALALLAAGIWKQTRAARIAAISLLGVTLLKLFFHDLAELNQLYRVGALIAVAIVAILASFLYQRFAPHDESPPHA